MKRVMAIVLLVLFYGIIAATGFLPNPPFATINELRHFIFSKGFIKLLYVDGFSTIGVTLLCWLIGSIVGITFGLVLALAGKKMKIFVGILEFLRSVPSAMWIPFGIVLVGLGIKCSIVIAGFVVFLFMASETTYSDHLFVRERKLHLERLGLSIWKRIRVAHLYEVLSVVIPSSRIALTISLIVVIIAEMQAGSRLGLGARLISFQASQRGDGMLTIILLAGTIGMLLNTIVEYLEHLFVPWNKEMSE